MFKVFCKISKKFLRFQTKEIKIGDFSMASYFVHGSDIDYILNSEKDLESKKDKLEKLLLQTILQVEQRVTSAKNETILAKNEVISAEQRVTLEKDKILEAKNEVTLEKDKILELSLSLERNKNELKEYVLKYLQQKGKINVRGALEFCFQEIIKNVKDPNFKEPSNAALQELKNRKEFMSIFEAKCKIRQLRKEDVGLCLGGLYHTASKEFHGKDDEVVIYENTWIENERVALASIFTYCNVSYSFIDKNGQLIVPCPY